MEKISTLSLKLCSLIVGKKFSESIFLDNIFKSPLQTFVFCETFFLKSSIISIIRPLHDVLSKINLVVDNKCPN